MKSIKAVGVMSGSSLDGLDIAYCDFMIDTKLPGLVSQWNMLDTVSISYTKDYSNRLHKLKSKSALDLAMFHSEFGAYLGDTLKDLIHKHEWEPSFVSSHGHTIFHYPGQHMTFQLGAGQQIADHCQRPCITDLRQSDINFGGQGAPLATLADRFLFPGCTYYLNLGGIMNLSMLKDNKSIGYDLAPANQVLNHLARRAGFEMDKDGLLGAKGKVISNLLDKLKNHPFLRQPHPKSLDNAEVEQHWIQLFKDKADSTVDILRTYYEFIAYCIGSEIVQLRNQIGKDHLFEKILITGGGAHNVFLMKLIENQLEDLGIQLKPCERAVIDFKEALLIAYCGLFRWLEVPLPISQSTGARKDSIAGSIHLP